MPGLIGFVKNQKLNLMEEIIDALDKLTYSQKSKRDSVFSDKKVIISRVHLNILGEKNNPTCYKQVFCWVYGECYNFEEIMKHFDYKESKFFSNLLIFAYLDHKLSELLKIVNGVYSAVIYDKEKGILKLITDRFGLKHLYYWSDQENFAWCSELKGFLSFKAFKQIIDENAVDCFLTLGHMLGEITWFKNVKLIPASTILTFNIIKGELNQDRYWKWENIIQKEISFTEALEKLTTLWKKIVHRCYSSDKIGISLSGGLDSRAILAFSEPYLPNLVFTFGKKNCNDIKIAKKVASISQLPHKIFYLTEENWFNGRYDAVWRTDGQINLKHLHLPFVKDILKYEIDINLDGFIGDLIMGGSWTKNLNSRINENTAQKKFGSAIKYTNIYDTFFNINHEDAYFIDTRVRMFTLYGNIYLTTFLEERLPYVDNEIIEFIYSLPDEYRLNFKLSHKMFIKEYPLHFTKIPWQKTGYPITKKNNIFRKAISLIRIIFNYFGIVKNKRSLVDYKYWVKKLLKKPEINQILFSSEAKYLKFTKNNQFLKKIVQLHKKTRKDYSEEILRYLTMEIWFQQIFNGKYLSTKIN